MISGEKNHSSKTAAAGPSAAGLSIDRPATVATAVSGPMARVRTVCSRSPTAERGRLSAASDDGCHSSRWRREMASRHSVRPMASRLYQASWGSVASATPACPSWRSSDGMTAAQCGLVRTCSGLCSRSPITPTPAGTNSTASPVKVHSAGDSSSAQPSTNSRVSAAGTRLRRRLSAIFQRASADSGLGTTMLRSLPGRRSRSRGSNQPSNCQSPRIQRCRRCTSASWRVGDSSISSTSLSRPLRA